jgi:hypothetical protein
VERLKKKPTKIVAITFSTSIFDPMEGAKGSITNPGTKNTGSHFVSNVAPLEIKRRRKSISSRIKNETPP